MEKFRFNTGRTLDALTEGTFTALQALFEFYDDSLDHGEATNVLTRIIPADGKGKASNRPAEKIIVVDDGKSFGTADEMIEALIIGTEKGSHGPDKISDAGLGMKFASLSLGGTVEFVSRSDDGNTLYSRFDIEDLRAGRDYLGPKQEPPCDVAALWEKWAPSNYETGAMIIVSDLYEHGYQSCDSWVQALHYAGADRPGTRYARAINAGAFTLSTAVNGGVARTIQAVDYLATLDPATKLLYDATQSYTPANSKGSPCLYGIRLYSTEKGSTSQSGIYVTVADIMLMLDSSDWLGMYTDSSKSSRWTLRAEITFDTKDELRKAMMLKSFKHSAVPITSAFGDHLRNSKFGSEVTQHLKTLEAAANANNRIKGLKSLNAEEAAFVNSLDDRLVYGPSRKLRSLKGIVTAFKSVKLSDPRVLGELKGDTLCYNLRNAKVNDLLGDATSSPDSRKVGRALVAVDAFRRELEEKEVSVPTNEFFHFLTNLVTMT